MRKSRGKKRPFEVFLREFFGFPTISVLSIALRVETEFNDPTSLKSTCHGIPIEPFKDSLATLFDIDVPEMSEGYLPLEFFTFLINSVMKADGKKFIYSKRHISMLLHFLKTDWMERFEIQRSGRGQDLIVRVPRLKQHFTTPITNKPFLLTFTKKEFLIPDTVPDDLEPSLKRLMVRPYPKRYPFRYWFPIKDIYTYGE